MHEDELERRVRLTLEREKKLDAYYVGSTATPMRFYDDGVSATGIGKDDGEPNFQQQGSETDLEEDDSELDF